MGPHSKPFALDTNVLFDLVEKEPIAVRFHRTALDSGVPLVVTFTVLRELGTAAADDSDPGRKGFAHLILTKMVTWQITPIPKNGLYVDYAEDFSKWIRDAGILPAHERNDGLILAEASLYGMNILITSDNHFYKHPAKLSLAFNSCQLPLPVIPLRPALATTLMLTGRKSSPGK